MTRQPTHLIDRSSARVATLDVRRSDGRHEGTIRLDSTPPQLRGLFEQFEEIVEGQMFSLLDDIEQKIEAASLRVVFADGDESVVGDLQVYPSTRAVSFVIREPAAAMSLSEPEHA